MDQLELDFYGGDHTPGLFCFRFHDENDPDGVAEHVLDDLLAENGMVTRSKERIQLAGDAPIVYAMAAATATPAAVAMVVRAWIGRHRGRAIVLSVPGHMDLRIEGRPPTEEEIRVLEGFVERTIADPERGDPPPDSGTTEA